MTPQDHREAALHALYEADQRREGIPTLEGLSKRSTAIVSGVWGSRESLDGAIGDASTGWRVERMPPVDRNVLRIALWELRSRPEVPVPVVIAEAVRLAKTYSTARSGAFVNGVLSKLATERDRE
ncbi:MAG TPA: transcription antitermination factor NusB [Acidimicrobiia bacterium]|nr:transcription antitermination factor NusB [Acidimicrobiia bacterium]